MARSFRPRPPRSSSAAPLGRLRQRGELRPAERGPGETPPPFGRFGQEDPGALTLRRIATGLGHDIGDFPDEMFLTVPGQGSWRSDDLHSDRSSDLASIRWMNAAVFSRWK